MQFRGCRTDVVTATRLHLDAQALQGPFAERGIARYVASLITALRAIDAPIAGIGLHPSAPAIGDTYAHIRDDPATRRTTIRRWRELLASGGPLLHVVMSAFEGMDPLQSLWPPFILDSGVPLAAIVYDTIPFRYRDIYQSSPSQRQFYEARARLLRRCDRFLTISGSAARDLVEDLDVDASKIRVIGTGVEERFQPADDVERSQRIVRDTTAVTRPFVLDVAGWPDTKNVPALLRAWAQVGHAVRAHYQLVIACRLPSETEQRWRAVMAECGLCDNDVVLTGFITDDVLLALYQLASLLVCPSLHEGFGLPVAEAAACGCPAIASNTSSLPEVLDFPPSTFPPDDPSAMAALIERSLVDDAFRLALVAAGDAAVRSHRWSSVATRFLGAVSDLSAGSRLEPRRRVAIIALGAEIDSLPTPTSNEIRQPLIDFYSQDRPLPRRDGVRVFPVSAFGHIVDGGSYDLVISVGSPPSAPNANVRIVSGCGIASAVRATLDEERIASGQPAGLTA